MEFLSKSLEETQKTAGVFLENLSPSKEGATTIALSGNLGSGKTTFVQACAKILGLKENITSPTFVIIKTYNLPLTTYKKLIHIDAYRLKSGEELKKLDWLEILSNPDDLIFIEWPENVYDVIPKNVIKITFEFVDNKIRKIKI